MKSVDELFIIGTHLQQYRHATRSPELYWEEAIKRDPLDSRCNTALGKLCLYRGQFAKAEEYFRNAIRRLVSRNPNPYDGEALLSSWPDAAIFRPLRGSLRCVLQIHVELCLAICRILCDRAELDCRNQQWDRAIEHLDRVLKVNSDHLQARDLKAMVF